MLSCAMLKGKDFGAAIGRAIKLKLDAGAAKSKAEIARHFGMKPPSLADWVNKGSVSKDKLPEMWRYFSDVAGPDHWGMTPDEWPAGLANINPGCENIHTSRNDSGDLLLSANGAMQQNTTGLQKRDGATAWPFAPVDERRFNSLSERAQGFALGQFQAAIVEAERLFGAQDENAA